jgi:hypothetical protein
MTGIVKPAAGIMAAFLALAVTSAAASASPVPAHRGHLPAAASSLRPASGAGQVDLFVGTPWHTVYQARLGYSASFSDVEATGRDSAWAIGIRLHNVTTTGGFAARWNGHRWRLVSLPLTGFDPVSVSASSPDNVWIFGFMLARPGHEVSTAKALRWNGHRFQVVTLPAEPPDTWDSASALMSVAFAANDVWVTGGVVQQHGRLVTLAWEGSLGGWAESTVPVAVTALSGTSDTDLLAMGTSTGDSSVRSLTYRWDGGSWQGTTTPRLFDSSIAVRSPHDIWITGSTAAQDSGHGILSTVEHFNGSRWRRYIVVSSGASYAVLAGHGGMWDGPYLYEAGGRWYSPTGTLFSGQCQQTGFAGAMAGIPGTSATLTASGCTEAGHTRSLARIMIHGTV